MYRWFSFSFPCPFGMLKYQLAVDEEPTYFLWPITARPLYSEQLHISLSVEVRLGFESFTICNSTGSIFLLLLSFTQSILLWIFLLSSCQSITVLFLSSIITIIIINDLFLFMKSSSGMSYTFIDWSSNFFFYRLIIWSYNWSHYNLNLFISLLHNDGFSVT